MVWIIILKREIKFNYLIQKSKWTKIVIRRSRERTFKVGETSQENRQKISYCRRIDDRNIWRRFMLMSFLLSELLTQLNTFSVSRLFNTIVFWNGSCYKCALGTEDLQWQQTVISWCSFQNIPISAICFCDTISNWNE